MKDHQFDNHWLFQSVLFLKQGDENDSGGTLSGNKKKVYVLMKILKKCYEDVNITSFKVKFSLDCYSIRSLYFQMKFAVDRSLEGRRYETDPIGLSFKRVLRYWTVRNKFEEARIHSDLAKIGVTNIRVKEEELVFELQGKPENRKMATLVQCRT